MAKKTLPMPAFVRPDNAGKWDYRPDKGLLFGQSEDWRKTHKIKPSGGDKVRVHLLLIDLQNDFCQKEGSLYVGGRSGNGAIEDTKKIAAFIYGNLDRITDITATLDTHFAYQIFSPSFWQNKEGKAPAPFTTVTSEMVGKGELVPAMSVANWLCDGNYAWLCKQARFYCEELEKAGKYQLYLWPPHCLLGDPGYNLAGLINEARLFHSYVRGSQSNCEVKGGNPLTENYSVLRPEVLERFDGKALDSKNVQFIKTLLDSDVVIIAGQAASHCVKSSIEDLLNEIKAQDESLARKVYIMTDCSSSVAIPDGKGGFIADFTPQAEAAFKLFADAGMHLVKSTDSIDSWPDIKL